MSATEIVPGAVFIDRSMNDASPGRTPCISNPAHLCWRTPPYGFSWTMSGTPIGSGYLGEQLIDCADAVWHEPDGLVVRAVDKPDAARWTETGFELIDVHSFARTAS